MSMWEYTELAHDAIKVVAKSTLSSEDKLAFFFNLFSLISAYDVSYIAFRETELFLQHRYLAQIPLKRLPDDYDLYEVVYDEAFYPAGYRKITPDEIDRDWVFLLSKDMHADAVKHLGQQQNHRREQLYDAVYYVRPGDKHVPLPGLYLDRNNTMWQKLVDDGVMPKSLGDKVPEWSRLETVRRSMQLMIDEHTRGNKDASPVLLMLYGYLYHEITLFDDSAKELLSEEKEAFAALRDSPILRAFLEQYHRDDSEAWERERFPALMSEDALAYYASDEPSLKAIEWWSQPAKDALTKMKAAD